MSMEPWCNNTGRGKPTYLEKKPSRSTILSTTNPTDWCGAVTMARQPAIFRYGKARLIRANHCRAQPVPCSILLPRPALSFSLQLNFTERAPERPTDLCLTYIVLLYVIFDPHKTVTTQNQDENSPTRSVSRTTSNSQQHKSTFLLHLFLVLHIYYYCYCSFIFVNNFSYKRRTLVRFQ
jgi:hypothetical protein